MSTEENLISKSSLTEKNRELQRELDSARALIKKYEGIIADLQAENSSNLKKFSHDLASPLQILSMTIESLQDRAPEFSTTLDRMKRSTDNMIEIINSIRKLQKAMPATPSKELKVV
ncbi:sensor histidine kinase [Bacteriovorax stolpii]|uniref:histidine kinase n=1 Tax=Bacteriovorax stolpii TaxID=960 RepID=A0A2K9NXC6_BACTC|nr:histidine kinase dimerization/phospho-acceptor domain-containing protein [Bacteriovorax stolpii]AUN99735.1 hypothetical protein C0V70_16800 [Bacteriovorax stolpii]QDK40268.1 sensor histidine kinase [Bacteriovorax stolpii]